VLVIQKDTLDLGDIREGEKAHATYVLENHGQANLVITDLRGDCGCTVATLEAEQKTIPPGGTQEVEVVFDSAGRPGPQSHTVRLDTNDPNHRETFLTLRVNVVTLFQITPSPRLDFRNAHRGEVLARTLNVLPSDKRAKLEIVSFSMPGGALKATPQPIVRGEAHGYELRFQVDENAPLGEVLSNGRLTVRVGDKEETKGISVLGTVLGDLTVRPPIVRGSLEAPSPRGMELRPVTVSSVSGKPFRFEGVDAGPNFVTTVEGGAENGGYTVKIKIADGAPDGPCAAMLRIRTNSPVQPLIEVPVYANVAPRLQADPPIVLLNVGSDASEATRQVVLRQPSLADYTILKVTCDSEFVAARVVEEPDPRPGAHRLEVTANPRSASADRSEATVTVTTDVPGAEQFTIPVVVGASVETGGTKGP